MREDPMTTEYGQSNLRTLMSSLFTNPDVEQDIKRRSAKKIIAECNAKGRESKHSKLHLEELLNKSALPQGLDPIYM